MYACFSSWVAICFRSFLSPETSRGAEQYFELAQDRQQVLPEPRVVLRHREMADAFHLREARPPYGVSGRGGLLGGTRVVVLPGEKVDRTPVGVDLVLSPAKVPVHAVEVRISPIDTRAALAVRPPHLAPGRFGALGRHEAVGPRRRHHRTVDVWHHGPVEEPALYLTRRLGADHRANLRPVAARQLEHDRPAHRAPEDDGPV